jgi:hypothetical protein
MTKILIVALLSFVLGGGFALFWSRWYENVKKERRIKDVEEQVVDIYI